MKTLHFVHKETGLSNGMIVQVSDEANVAHYPATEDHVIYEGEMDIFKQRLNHVTGALETYSPRPPDSDHEWNAESREFQLTPAANERRVMSVAQEEARNSAAAKIATLEAKQARALREHALGYDGARERLAALDHQIIELRSALSFTESG